MSLIEVVPELRDVQLSVERVPGTQLVHVAFGGHGGLVLTAGQAVELGRALLRHAPKGSRGRGAAGAHARRGAPAAGQPRGTR